MSKMIEIDVDGVILDLMGHLETFLRCEGFDFDRCAVVDYGFSTVEPEIRRRVFELFKSEEFIATIPYKVSISALKNAIERAYSAGFEVMFNSFVSTQSLVGVRERFLDGLIKYIGLPIRYWVSSSEGGGGFKRMLSSYACIEDCVENIERSQAKYRFLIAAPYNKDLGDLANAKNVWRFSSVILAFDFLVSGSEVGYDR